MTRLKNAGLSILSSVVTITILQAPNFSKAVQWHAHCGLAPGMKATQIIASVLSLCLIVLPACSATRARDEMTRRRSELDLNNAAWEAARNKLWNMCPNAPQSAADYRKGIQIRSASNDPFRGCDLRLVKLTNGATFDDWDWVWFPNYTTIVAVHEDELRNRLKPKVYEEFMLGLSRHLAKRVDSGDISPQQFMHAFNEGWKWLYAKMQEEQVLLQSNLQSAQQADAAAWNTLSSIATGLATVATVAIVASAAVSASRPAPAPVQAQQPPQPTRCQYLGGGILQCW